MFYALILSSQKFYWGLQIAILPYDKKVCALILLPLCQNMQILACKNLSCQFCFTWDTELNTHKKHQRKVPTELTQAWEAIYLH